MGNQTLDERSVAPAGPCPPVRARYGALLAVVLFVPALLAAAFAVASTDGFATCLNYGRGCSTVALPGELFNPSLLAALAGAAVVWSVPGYSRRAGRIRAVALAGQCAAEAVALAVVLSHAS